jgi:hypothetical protein
MRVQESPVADDPYRMCSPQHHQGKAQTVGLVFQRHVTELLKPGGIWVT